MVGGRPGPVQPQEKRSGQAPGSRPGQTMQPPPLTWLNSTTRCPRCFSFFSSLSSTSILPLADTMLCPAGGQAGRAGEETGWAAARV